MATEIKEPSHLVSTKEYQEFIAFKMSDNRSMVEYNRFKQDCRKRALEMANHELMSDKAMYNKNATWEEGKRGDENGKGWIPPKTDVIALADKYYKWLIEIPS